MVINAARILFSLISNAILEKNISEDVIKEINEQSLQEAFELAQRHDIANIAGEALFKHKLIDERLEIAQKYKKAMLSSVVRYQRQCLELKRVCDLLEEKQIPYMPLKGIVVRKFYPDPWMRTSCDIDILVKNEDIKVAGDVLVQNLGYKNISKGAHDWGFISENGIKTELHFELIEENASGIIKSKISSKCLQQAWSTACVAEGTDYRYIMSDELFYFYHISHMAKHFLRGGCGIRPIIDLCLLNKQGYGKNINIQTILKEEGLFSFWEAINELCEVWFSGKTHNELTKRLEDYILSGGVYGSEKNTIKVQRTEDEGKLKLYIDWIFMPYSRMTLKYPILRKRPYLLPVYWIIRWFEFLKPGGKDRAKHNIRNKVQIEKMEIIEARRLLSDLDIV